MTKEEILNVVEIVSDVLLEMKDKLETGIEFGENNYLDIKRIISIIDRNIDFITKSL